MKRSLEDLLREAPLTAPSRQLSDRIDDAFRRAGVRGSRWFAAPIPLWACMAGALACAALGYVARGRAAQPGVVYILPADGELGRVLRGESARPPEDFYKGLKVEVTTRGPGKL